MFAFLVYLLSRSYVLFDQRHGEQRNREEGNSSRFDPNQSNEHFFLLFPPPPLSARRLPIPITITSFFAMLCIPFPIQDREEVRRVMNKWA